jgi:flagella basal body P-ring formation protein FlgA
MKRCFLIALLMLWGSRGIEAIALSDYLDSLFSSHWPDSGFATIWEPVKGSNPPEFSDKVQFRLVSPEPVQWRGPMILTFLAESPDGFQKRFSLRGTLRVFGPGVLPREKIKRGEALSDAKVLCTTIEWTRVAGTPLYSLDDTAGKLAARTLAPGRPILREYLRDKSVVIPGQEIYVEAAAGNVCARLRVRALEEGAEGEIIRVTAQSSGRSLRVRVQNSQTARVIE